MIEEKQCLEDIAILTGGQVISEDLELKLENVKIDMTWIMLKRVKIDKDNSTIVSWCWRKNQISKQDVIKLKQQVDETTSDYDKEKLQERLAKLSWWCCRNKSWWCNRS